MKFGTDIWASKIKRKLQFSKNWFGFKVEKYHVVIKIRCFKIVYKYQIHKAYTLVETVVRETWAVDDSPNLGSFSTSTGSSFTSARKK